MGSTDSIRRVAVGPITGPWTLLRDLFFGLERCTRSGWRDLAWIACGFAVGWWVYVPVHELLHAGACELSGGTVTELEIATLYGGALLERALPFVVAGGDYAGRLSGFDTGGSDLVYAATVVGPFVLTLFPGVFALRRAIGRASSWTFGFWIPVATAPLLSATGDAYELGSILVTRVAPWSAEPARELVRGEDLFRVAGDLSEHGDGAPWAGLIAAAFVGLLWIGWTPRARGRDRVGAESAAHRAGLTTVRRWCTLPQRGGFCRTHRRRTAAHSPRAAIRAGTTLA